MSVLGVCFRLVLSGLLATSCASPSIKAKPRSNETVNDLNRVHTQNENTDFYTDEKCELRFKRDLCAELNWLEQPTLGKVIRLEIQFFAPSSGKSASHPGLNNLRIYGWMKSHGHGTSESFELSDGGDSVILVDNIRFTMRGTWQFHIEILNGQDVVVDDAISEIHI